LAHRRRSAAARIVSAQAIWLVALAVLVTACEREQRRFSEPVGNAPLAPAVAIATIQPGGSRPSSSGTTATPAMDRSGPYEENAYAISQGKRLFTWYNCIGCHAHGGGGIGPPLMDNAWRYGYAPDAIFTTIVQGRPNGMPAFAGRVPEQQVWQLVAYVRSMSAMVRADAAPGRADAMQAGEPELRRDRAQPRPEIVPKPKPVTP
jgi:cytochrome c oxidase cbb3-type subunit 3